MLNCALIDVSWQPPSQRHLRKLLFCSKPPWSSHRPRRTTQPLANATIAVACTSAAVRCRPYTSSCLLQLLLLRAPVTERFHRRRRRWRLLILVHIRIGGRDAVHGASGSGSAAKSMCGLGQAAVICAAAAEMSATGWAAAAVGYALADPWHGSRRPASPCWVRMRRGLRQRALLSKRQLLLLLWQRRRLVWLVLWVRQQLGGRRLLLVCCPSLVLAASTCGIASCFRCRLEAAVGAGAALRGWRGGISIRSAEAAAAATHEGGIACARVARADAGSRGRVLTGRVVVSLLLRS